MFDGRRSERRRAELAREVERMASFVNAPTVVCPSLDEVNRLPEILATISYPDLAALRIGRHAPWIPETERPGFRAYLIHSDKRIVFRYRVGSPGLGMVDVDAQQFGQEPGHVLARKIRIRVAGAVARRDVQHSVVAENNATS